MDDSGEQTRSAFDLSNQLGMSSGPGTLMQRRQFFSKVILLLLVLNNYWMRLSMISRIMQTEVNVICRSETEADNIDQGLNSS